MQIGAAWTWRPLAAWPVSPLVGAGTGVTIANVGNVEPAASDPDLAWSVRLLAGGDVRVSDEVGLRLAYTLSAPLAGAPLPLAHALTLSVSIVVDGVVQW
jgi:hypothetical protein